MENKKLSIKRLILAILMLVGLGYVSYWGWNNYEPMIEPVESEPWFAAYVDVTATPPYSFEHIGENIIQKNVVLSFIVSSHEDPCIPTWGGAYTLDEARLALDLDRRIARFRQQEGDIAISFGGLINDELALKCENHDSLLRAYEQVIDRYEIDTIDLDIEGEALSDVVSLKRRAKVIAELQSIRRDDGQNLAVWLTLPVAPQGLTQNGTNAVAIMLEEGVDLAGVNVMTMDYGESRSEKQSMFEASKQALLETHRQLGILFKNAGINLNDAAVWTKIGATPMIGQNDVVSEIFTLDDAKLFNEFTVSQRISRMSMWSANRDVQCGSNYVNLTVVSDSCSGVKQDKLAYANILGNNFLGDIKSNSSKVTVESTGAPIIVDDPAKSPYQIWAENATYLEGTKVVWHGNVYQAKWWTRGDLPDNPVLQSYETPWQLIGPVLPGETPIPQPTLPPGTFPEWDGTVIYDKGEKVLFDGTPYEAKWWTQGDSPAASTSNPDSSPWIALTRNQIETILKER